VYEPSVFVQFAFAEHSFTVAHSSMSAEERIQFTQNNQSHSVPIKTFLYKKNLQLQNGAVDLHDVITEKTSCYKTKHVSLSELIATVCAIAARRLVCDALCSREHASVLSV